MSFAITFSSPNKADRVLAIHSESIPTLNTVRNAAITSLGDTSWDVAQWTEEPSTVHRPRTPERPAVRKTVLRELLGATEGLAREMSQVRADIRSLQEGRDRDQRELSTVKVELSTVKVELIEEREELSALKARFIEEREEKLCERDVVEMHESLDRCLQGFSDIIFATSHKPGHLTEAEKALLKSFKSDYLTYLLSNPPAKLPRHVAQLRIKALNVLTEPELKLCRFLFKRWKDGRVERNEQQHQQPDRETALERIKETGLDAEDLITLEVFLETNPARLPGLGEHAGDPHLRLFAPSGTYKKVAVLREELDKLRAGRAVAE
ncbi:hypothetical protein B0H14DRAFT_3864614 [Mycena olivaceomarginata]|nr:hypothetical protein B0H14DRAFT_3864614 [Mycena olivaceomarginata]